VEARSPGPGQGSEFVVRLPLMPILEEPATALLKPEANAKSQSRETRRRIRVAEDNTDLAQGMAMLLRIMGFEIELASDGLDALHQAKAFRPDVILLDIGMPRLNGYEAARRIRKVDGLKRTKLVALTGWGKADDRRQSEEAGFDAHLAKSLDVDALSRLLAEWKRA
jgi:CheY-like chemotaxis protein